ncbi:hypothetical protein LTR78_010298 [Recurvomyces mirabilis]|uniref:Major facilitator superfamily (MFS) profile domain-containing protein n=1 Tax=Recurvomyces mirabilis TaxID=574656 RepID=A0AAE0TLZ1_9PEZI|nr:hypothetical protein LTR78_010298 [Recurvomyces mirabilis]KAK5149632.1 hypothetical protein LTS14_010763 [Recurvomyces mirabilis]
MFDADAFRNAPFNVFAVASFTGFLGLYIPFFYIQEYALAHGMKTMPDLASSTLAILNAGSVIGRIVPGFIADEIGLLNTYLTCTFGAALCGFIWIACKSIGGIVVFTIFYGFFSGCAAALQPAVLASLAPQPNIVGTWVGMGSLFSSTGLLLGSPLGGLIYDHSGWTSLQLWCACLVVACTVATAATRVLRSGTGIMTKV